MVILIAAAQQNLQLKGLDTNPISFLYGRGASKGLWPDDAPLFIINIWIVLLLKN